jgi:hypothetical protein
MGMAQKLDPTRFKTADIWEIEGCPLRGLYGRACANAVLPGALLLSIAMDSSPCKKGFPQVAEVASASVRRGMAGRKFLNGAVQKK